MNKVISTSKSSIFDCPYESNYQEVHKGIALNGRIKPHFLIAKEGMK
jgi:hypothetical protein